MSITIECPSGLIFEARRTWKLGDRKILLDRDNLRSGKLLHLMLGAVAGPVLNPGPYSFDGPKISWGRLTHADIVAATIAVRRATRPTFEFNSQCEFCSNTMKLEIDLRDIELKKASEEGIEHIRSQVPVAYKVQEQSEESDVPVGPIISMSLRLLTGQDQLDLMKYQKQENDGGMAEVQNCMHIVTLRVGDGEEMNAEQHFSKIRAFYADAAWGFQGVLDELIEQLGGGVESELDVACSKCGGEQTQPLPFNQAFFIPQDKGRSSFKVVRSETK